MPTPAELLAACDRLLTVEREVGEMDQQSRDWFFGKEGHADYFTVARALRALLEEGAKDTERLCPLHRSLAVKLAEFPQQYGCPQCAVNHVAELEGLIAEMWPHLTGHAKLLRFNNSEAARIFERSNMEGVEEVIAAIDDARSGKEGK